MKNFLPTIILRHRRENLKKCSLRGLESREDLLFFTYPKDSLPPLSGYVLLSFDGPPLCPDDRGIVLLDGTWRYAHTMYKNTPELSTLPQRSLPREFKTAYPRKQEDCAEPTRGLASIEALYVAYLLLGRDPKGLLDNYHWKEEFLNSRSLTT